jgi:hypothetical protein
MLTVGAEKDPVGVIEVKTEEKAMEPPEVPPAEFDTRSA